MSAANGERNGKAEKERGGISPGSNARERARLRARWRAMTTDGVFASLHGRLLGLALSGNTQALKLFLEYLIGGPDQVAERTRDERV